jgi:hypothetical protein
MRRREESNSASRGPVPVSTLLPSTRAAIEAARAPGTDSFLYSGNRHESVPRALLTDRRLTPLERNAWQVFRLVVQDDCITSFPTYEQLRPYLTSLPCAAQASDETVARSLALLRLTRWLTLARRRRNAQTGRIEGNLYVLHDEALSPYEAIQLDPNYLELVSHSLTHSSKSLQRVGQYTLKEISEDPMLSGRVLPSRLGMVMQRLSRLSWVDTEIPSSDSEEGETPLNASLRNPKTDSTVRTDLLNKDTSTVPRARDDQPLRLPPAFAKLPREQQSGALAALRQVENELRQPVLDEWAARCEASGIRNPAGYLFGIIQKALRGEFRAWMGQRKSR